MLDVELNVAYAKNSLRLDSPEMKQIQESAKENKIAVSLGFSEKDNHSVYIAQVMIDPAGEIKFHRRKMKPTHMERTIFGDASGECFSSVAELPFARVGSLSCWEHIQPLLKYQTISQQEDIHVAAWPNVFPHTGGQDLWSMSAEGGRFRTSSWLICVLRCLACSYPMKLCDRVALRFPIFGCHPGVCMVLADA